MKAATLLLAAALLYACGGSRHRVTVEAVADDCVQVLYFHGKQRCATCTAIERLTREVIDSIGSEKVVLRIIDIAENEALADRYQAGWSALILDRNGRIITHDAAQRLLGRSLSESRRPFSQRQIRL